MKAKPILLLVCLFLFSLWAEAGHTVQMVKGSTNNQLEVLDWGGKGRPVLFLSGLTNTAHVYDDFAPRFTNKFRVYGLSRRGYGKSEQTKTGYGIDTLSNDILAVMNALRLDKVILIGHSLAGDEMTTFATQHPERVAHIVYLDAAYRHNGPLKLPYPAPLKRTAADSASVQALSSYLKRARGLAFNEDELRHQYVFSAQGKLTRDVTPGPLGRTIVKGVRVPDYKPVKSPALAIYGQRTTAQQYFPAYPLLDPTAQQKATAEFMPAWQQYYAEEVTRFKTEKPDGRVLEIPGADHYVFLTHPAETEKAIRDFLK